MTLSYSTKNIVSLIIAINPVNNIVSESAENYADYLMIRNQTGQSRLNCIWIAD